MTSAVVKRLRAEIAQCEAKLCELKRQLNEAQENVHHVSGASLEVQPSSPETSYEASNWPWPLGAEEYKRYGRQMILPEVSLKGQLNLRDASVLIVGLGGLGCPAAAYLAGAGIGTIGLVDGDVVELSNLHRQILHTTARVGQLKVESVKLSLEQLNPGVKFIPHPSHLTPSTALSAFAEYDLILDCTDHPSSRYLVSDAAVLCGKPLISGAALRTEGQLLRLNFRYPSSREPGTRGPCYRCVFPTPPLPETVIPCGEGGILGPVVGIIGVLMALEATKLIASGMHLPKDPSDGADSREAPPAESPKHSMLLFSAYSDPPFRTIRLRGKRSACLACSATPSITASSVTSGTFDYVRFCGTLAEQRLAEEYRISAQQLAALLDKPEAQPPVSRGTGESQVQGGLEPASNALLLDVRPRPQFALCSLPGSVNVPLPDLMAARSMDDLSRLARAEGSREATLPKEIITICRLGNDSQVAAKQLQRLKSEGEIETRDSVGQDRPRWTEVRVRDVKGGFEAWREEVDQDWPAY